MNVFKYYQEYRLISTFAMRFPDIQLKPPSIRAMSQIQNLWDKKDSPSYRRSQLFLKGTLQTHSLLGRDSKNILKTFPIAALACVTTVQIPAAEDPVTS